MGFPVLWLAPRKLCPGRVEEVFHDAGLIRVDAVRFAADRSGLHGLCAGAPGRDAAQRLDAGF